MSFNTLSNAFDSSMTGPLITSFLISQGLVGAAARYMTMRSTMMMLGPLLWGTFLADVVIRSLGTDYARVIRAIFAFAQIRLTHTYGWTYSEQSR
jgi:uncharacterized protein YaaW (UPF0174 family)